MTNLNSNNDMSYQNLNLLSYINFKESNKINKS